MSKQIKVHSPQRHENRSKGGRNTPLHYSHSPYSWNNSPSLDLKGIGQEDSTSGPSSPRGIPIPIPSKHMERYTTSGPSSIGNTSVPASPLYDVYGSYSPKSKGTDDISPLVVPSNFLNQSHDSRMGSPTIGTSFPHSHQSTGVPVPNVNGDDTPGGFLKSPANPYPTNSYAPVSFNTPHVGSNASYPAGFTTEPFSVSPSVLSRGFVDSILGNTNTTNPPAQSAPSSSSASISNASSVAENLPLCPEDEDCILINEKAHQRKFAHTCRLFPCYHGHINRHAKLFRHVPGQVVLPEGVSKKLSTQALTSVTFSSISQEAPNAYRIYVAHQGKKYELFGDWATVKVHTFKRYLHQVCSIPPASQSLVAAKTSQAMDDDISSVKSYGIEQDALILLSNKEEDLSALRIAFDDL